MPTVKNVAIEYRWAQNHRDQLPALTAELVQRQVAVIVTGGGTPTAPAAKEASTTVPIVFMIGGDPVKVGLVTSLNRPGGNITGVSFLSAMLVAKQFEVLHETARQTNQEADNRVRATWLVPTNAAVVNECTCAPNGAWRGRSDRARDP
jgi:ABC-type uncharacterized transport system substrate-binding protein